MKKKRNQRNLSALLFSLAVIIISSAASEADEITSLRIFQTLPHNPSEMSPMELSDMYRRLRATRAMVFGVSGGNKSSPSASGSTMTSNNAIFRPTLEIYTPAERRDYLVKKGRNCHPPDIKGNHNNSDDDVLSRYDSLTLMSSNSYYDNANMKKEGNNSQSRSRGLLLERLAIDLWKFCLLYNGDGHVYLGYEEAQLLSPLKTVLNDVNANYGVVVSSTEGDDDDNIYYLHDSFMAISPSNPAKGELSKMIRVLLETPNDKLTLRRPMLSSRMIVDSGGETTSSGSKSWSFLRSHCIDVAKDDTNNIGDDDDGEISSQKTAASCPLSGGGYCCLAFPPPPNENIAQSGSDIPVIALRHPMSAVTALPSSASHVGGALPYKLEAEAHPTKAGSATARTLNLGVIPTTDLPYISTVRLLRDHTSSMPTSPTTRFPNHPADTPNFFDILFENDCLPYTKECFRCFKDISNEAPQPMESQEEDDGVNGASYMQTKRRNLLGGQRPMENACSFCQLECPCYCDVLCKIRPPPKEVVRTYAVRPPQYKKAVHRLVPRIIHQTWFEPITQEKYPNFSRLIESWKNSGWEYYFYDDESAKEFLSIHFPREVVEAYDSIIPGAFKADLFRYCVLLIRGGVYADVDVLLESNLDEAIANDVGFMTPIDTPGAEVQHQSCLWNGFIASAPGHPFLVRTIEIVVNNIRNRFTSVDYDDMLCPNPILSVSHTLDTLFTCGPCILGAGINNLLGLHMQNQFEPGEVNIWQSERNNTLDITVSPDDPRLLIPGRTIILNQDKNDMGAHRFTLAESHLIVAATDMPDYDDRPSTQEHYSKTHEQAGIYGIRKLYTDTKRANEEISFVVESL